MDKNNVQLSDEELLQFRMFQEQMRGYRPLPEDSDYIEIKLTPKEVKKSSYVAKTLSNDEYIVTVEVETMKYNSFKAFFYSFRDFGYNVANFIANVIIS